MDSARNIAFIHGTFPFGGAERVTIDIARYVRDKGYRTFVFTTEFDRSKMPEGGDMPFEVIVLPEKDVVRSRKDAEFICKAIAEHNIGITVAVAKRLRHIGMIRETGCKIVYAHHNMPFHEAQASVDRAWRKGRRNPLRFLEWMFISYPKYVIFGQAKKREEKFYRSSYDEADRYVMLCDEYRDEIVRRLGLDPHNNRIRVIWNSEYIPDKINLDKENIILYSGRLSYADKRLDRLIRIWKSASGKLEGWNLVIAGEGKERKSLEKMVRNLDVPRVTFTGYTNNISSLYAKASILALVSTYEGWPLCLTEAQANGVIPIAFDSCAGIREILSPSGRNGFLVKAFDLEEFARVLVSIAEMDEDRKCGIRRNVIEKARKEYDPELVGSMWKALFDELYGTEASSHK